LPNIKGLETDTLNTLGVYCTCWWQWIFNLMLMSVWALTLHLKCLAISSLLGMLRPV